MNTGGQTPGSDTSATTWYLPITSASRVEDDQGFLAMRKFLGVLTRLWAPADISFVTCSDAERQLTMGWQVASPDPVASKRLARDIRAVLQQVAPWMGTSEETAIAPWPAAAPTRYCFERAATGTGDLVPTKSLVWPAIQALPAGEPWHMVLSLDLLPEPSTGVDKGIDPTGISITDAEPEGTDDSDVVCRLVLHGGQEDAALIAALAGEDMAGVVGLRALPISDVREAASLTLPYTSVGHLLALPSRLRGLMPEHRVRSSRELLDVLDEGASKHVLIQGLSGGGKSTLLEHLIDDSFSRGRPAFLVDYHDGRIVEQAAARARHHGMDPVVVWFGDQSVRPKNRPCVSLTRAPRGVDPRVWANEAWVLTRDQMHDDRMRPEFVGPVGDRAGQILLTALCLDSGMPPATVADIPSLLDAKNPELRRDVFARTGDLDLARAMVNEVMPMVQAKDPDNAAIWLTSKFQPLLATPVITDILSGKGRNVDLEQALSQGRPLLIHAPADQLGDAGSRIVGAILLYRMWLWARQQGSPVDYDVVIDEWHLNPLSTVRRMLAEGRKFGLRLLLANQSVAQLPNQLRDVAFANVGSVVTFATAPADAQYLDGLFPTIRVGALQRLPKFHAAVTTRTRDLVVKAPAPFPTAPRLRPEPAFIADSGGAERDDIEPTVDIDDGVWDRLFGITPRRARPAFDISVDAQPEGVATELATPDASGPSSSASIPPRIVCAAFTRSASTRESEDRVVLGNEVLGQVGFSTLEAQSAVIGVVDGMGGRPAGGDAADLVAGEILRLASERRVTEPDRWIKQSQIRLAAWEGLDPQSRGMGAKAAVASVTRAGVRVARVGDVMVLWTDGEKVVDLDDVAKRGTGARALEGGLGQQLRVDTHEMDEDVSRVLIASDGVLGVIDREGLLSLVRDAASATAVVEVLIKRVSDRLADDVSVACLDLAT